MKCDSPVAIVTVVLQLCYGGWFRLVPRYTGGPTDPAAELFNPNIRTREVHVMARPIIPIAVRRSELGRDLEVQSKGGQWLPWPLLSVASRENTIVAFAAHYAANGNTWPVDSFQWSVGRQPMERVQSPENTDQQQQVEQQVEQQEQEQQTDDVQDAPDDTQDNAPQDQEDEQVQQEDQQDAEQEQPPMTIEDMVRRIASELDGQVKDDLMARFEEFKLNNPTPTEVGPTVRIEVKTPTVQVTHDGLFHSEFATLLHNAAIGQHTFLPGPPGSGKTHAAKQVADTLGWRYVEISFSPDLPESRIWGGRTPDGFMETPLLEGLRHAMENPDSGLVALFDEMDAARAALLVGMNSAMANNRVSAPNGDRLSWGDNVVFIGAANTFGTGPTAEFAGRNKLDAATLDRFAYIPWDTDPIMEASVVRSFLHGDHERTADAWLDAWRTLRENVKNYGLKTFVTMRGARNGARLVASGVDMHKAMMLVIGNKLPADQWSKVCPF